MNLRQFVKHGINASVNASHQFHLRLAEVGGDTGVRQGRTQCCRVRCQRQSARSLGTQAFFFDTTAHTQQPLGCQPV